MSLFSKIKTAVTTNSSKGRIKTGKSLKAVMQAVDFNVFRFRKKTGKQILGKRGGKQDQRQLQDCTIIDLENDYKIYALNIDQFLAKQNGKYKSQLIGPNGKVQQNNIRSLNNFNLEFLPKEISTDLKIEGSNKSQEELEFHSNKSGYAAWIEKNNKIVPLRKTKYNGIKIQGSASKKMIYREKRDGSLENSFIKTLGAYIISTIVDEKGIPLLEIDIDPRNYIPKKENSENENNVNTNNISFDDGTNGFEEEFNGEKDIFPSYIDANYDSRNSEKDYGKKSRENLSANEKNEIKKILGIQTLETRNNDSLDFREYGHGNILRAIEYLLNGQKLTKNIIDGVNTRFKSDKADLMDGSFNKYSIGQIKDIMEFVKSQVEPNSNQSESIGLSIYKTIQTVDAGELEQIKQYCVKNIIGFKYNGEKGELIFKGVSGKLEKIKQLLNN